MADKKKEQAYTRLIGYGIGAFGIIGIITLSYFGFKSFMESKEIDTTDEMPSQESITPGVMYPTGHIGVDGQYWAYTETSPETEFAERQEILDDGGITLWPEFSEQNLMWFSAHNPGTFSYIAEHLSVGDEVEVTTPSEYDQRHSYDDPDRLIYEITEVIESDIWAEDIVESAGKSATDIYNDGLEEPAIMIQHSGKEEDSVVLYFGQFVNKETINYTEE